MAYTKEQIKQNYPLPVYNYRVEIGGEPIAFSNVTGLNVEFGTHIYKESTIGPIAGPSVMRMPSQPTDVKITLKKGLVRKKSLPILYNWISTIQINQIEKKDILVHLLDEAGNPIITWNVLNAFPIKLDAPTFDASSNDAAIESMELMADKVLISES
jgi:phage tail-like protein